MTRRPSASQALAAQTAAAMANAISEEDQSPEIGETDAEVTPRGRGRPKGKKRDVAARITVNLDEARHRALERAAEDTGRSIHSLILGGIDLITNKPVKNPWE